MPPYYDMPYGSAPAVCFPLTEISVYFLFLICIWHSLRRKGKYLGFMMGGVVFGLLLEFVDVYFLKGYTYGRFLVMLGEKPLDIPFWIGVGWGIILYSSRLFTDRLGLPIFAAAALDALLALNIDATMDVTAYRLHMWDWGWFATHANPLTSQWFGIPWDNYFGWLVVIFTYSGFSRLFSKWKIRILIPFAAIVFSEMILFSLFNNIKPWFRDHLGIYSIHWLIGLLILLIGMILYGWKRKEPRLPFALGFPAWLVPAWFHIYFTIWFFLSGFYHESTWMTIFSLVNLLLGILIHLVGSFRNRLNLSKQAIL